MSIDGKIYNKIWSWLEYWQKQDGGYCCILKTAKGLCVGDEILPGSCYPFGSHDIAVTKDGRRFICYLHLMYLLIDDCFLGDQPVCSDSDQVLRVLEKMAIPAEIVKEA